MANALPWVKFEEIDKNAGRFLVSPLKRGMGTTLGNSLRRILLSSLEGTAIKAIKIEGIEHEYATIPYIAEDVIDIIFNLKGVIFKSYSEENKKVTINYNGKGVVTAKDIQTDADVEIVNPEHYIAELTDNGAFVVDITLGQGFGYAPAEANRNEGDFEINEISVDSSYSPITRVNHEVESIRVGKELDYDSLKLEVYTNGSIDVQVAVKEAATILVEQLGLFGAINKKPKIVEQVEENDPEQEQKKNVAVNLSIDDLELSARSSNCLKRAGIETVSELVNRGLDDLIQIKNFGKKSADEINDKLKQYGLALKNNGQGSEEVREDT